MNQELYLNNFSEPISEEVTSVLASSGAFVPVLSVTYESMLLSACEQIRSKAATPTALKF